MEEIFKDIEGYEGLYQVSNLGRVRSLERVVKNKAKLDVRKSRTMKQSLRPNGYLRVILHLNGKSKTISVHRLVGEAFLFKPQGGLIINHKNGVKTDNQVNNLEWCTHKENIEHAFRTGLSKKGIDHDNSKLTEEEVIAIRYKTSNLTQVEASKVYNISQSTISKIRRNELWRHL